MTSESPWPPHSRAHGGFFLPWTRKAGEHRFPSPPDPISNEIAPPASDPSQWQRPPTSSHSVASPLGAGPTHHLTKTASASLRGRTSNQIQDSESACRL